MTRDSINSAPTEANRAKHFVAFFKTYMSISTVVVASLPIPVASLHLVKTYGAQTKLFSVYTSLFCFLILGFIFFSRHALGRVLFVNETGGKRFVSSLPLLLIFGSIVMMFLYQSLLSDSLTVAKAREQAIAEGGEISSAYLYDLEHADSEDAELALSSGFLSDRDISYVERTNAGVRLHHKWRSRKFLSATVMPTPSTWIGCWCILRR